MTGMGAVSPVKRIPGMKHKAAWGVLALVSGAFLLGGAAAVEGGAPAPAGNIQPAGAAASPKTPAEAELIIAELEMALDAAGLRCKELEEILGREEEGNVPLESALAVANAEAEAYRERYKELRLNVESWGMESLGSDQALRERLIVAVREREQAMKRHAQALEQLLALSEAMVDYLKTSSTGDGAMRLRVEEQLRKADEILGYGAKRQAVEGETKPMDEGRVVSLKEDFRLAVLDIGKRSGVRLGLPMDLYRKDRLVGSGIVVDVREQVCGVIVQKIYKEGDQVKLSDRAEPHASTTVQF